MSATAELVRDAIERLPPGQLFCTRELLHLGPRGAVDVSLWRLVKDGVLSRLARGVFARPPTGDDFVELPSARDVAEIKARAFGKKLISDHPSANAELDLPLPEQKEFVFRVSGRSSKFRFKGTYIYLRAANARKLQLGDDSVGKTLRALWFLGRRKCWRLQPMIAQRLISDARFANRNITAWLPAWLQEFLRSCDVTITQRIFVARV